MTLLTRKLSGLFLLWLLPTALAQTGALEKFAGHNQTVQSGSAYSFVARALDENGDPEAGVFVTVALTTPVSFCSSPTVPTDSNGLAMIPCTGAVVAVPTAVTVVVVDSKGRLPAPPFSVVIVPPAPVLNGLQKKAGDGQIVAENTSFSVPLVVTDFISTVPQQGASLMVTTSPSGVASCVAAGLIDAQGLGTINCAALSVSETTVVQISVSDSLGQNLLHPFNAAVTDTDPSTPVELDVKPGSDRNSINCRHNGVVPVAILTTRMAKGDPLDFDASTVDPSTVAFGPNAASVAHRRAHIQDVDGDGDMDMVLHFRQRNTGIQCGNLEACLTGQTTNGTPIEGCDAIRTVGG